MNKFSQWGQSTILFYYDSVRYEWLQNEHFFPTLQENALLGDLSSKTFLGEHAPDSLEVQAFGPQFYRVPAYSQASALLLQKLMKTLSYKTLNFLQFKQEILKYETFSQ